MKNLFRFAAFLSFTSLLSSTLAADAKPGGYQPYTQAAFDAARGERRVLFFHATWCPNCKAANADILAHLAELPANIVIFKTDYDQEVALKKKYAITSQHTFVLVDDKGDAIRKWAGGGLKQIVAQVAKAAPGR